MPNNGQTLQDPFLNKLRKDKVPVAIYLVNGIKLQGVVASFDQYVVMLRNTVSQMVYKHAISTVVPARNVQFTGGPSAEPTEMETDAEYYQPGNVEEEIYAPFRCPCFSL